MEQAQLKYLDELQHDISSYLISGHAMSQYANKCKPGLSLVELTQVMHEQMKDVRKVELNKDKTKTKNHNKRNKQKIRVAYLDKNDIIYITERDNVITVFPNERIFVAKTMYSNKKSGKKYL